MIKKTCLELELAEPEFEEDPTFDVDVKGISLGYDGSLDSSC